MKGRRPGVRSRNYEPPARRPRHRCGRIGRELGFRTRDCQSKWRCRKLDVINRQARIASMSLSCVGADLAERGDRQVRNPTGEEFLDQPVRISRQISQTSSYERGRLHCQSLRRPSNDLSRLLCLLRAFHRSCTVECSSRRRRSASICSSTFSDISLSRSRPCRFASSRRLFNW